MLVFRGEPAFSPFRIEKKRTTLGQVCPALRQVQTEYVYLVNNTATLSAADISKLENLLQAQHQADGAFWPEYALLVAPRPGTISPWSSKASDMVHH